MLHLLRRLLYSCACVWLLLGICIKQSQGLGIPMLITRGSHYQVAHDIGKTFSRQIKEYFHLHPSLYPKWLPWCDSPQGKKICQDYLSVVNTTYPQYVSEVRGLADGAGLTFHEVFVMNLRSELDALLDNGLSKEPESCSDVHVNHPLSNTVAIGHNEDNSPLITDRGYIVSAVIEADHSQGAPAEAFTAYAYPGEVPGNAFAFNQAGLTFSVNALYPKEVLLQRMPRNIVTRAMLSSQNIEDVVHILQEKDIGGAYAFCANIGDLQKQPPTIYSLETAPDAVSKASKLSIYKVAAKATGQENSSGNYFHVNAYRQLNMTQRPSHIVSSLHRTRRIEALPLPDSVADIRTILGDTADTQYPLYRTPRPTDNASTVATALFDLGQCQLSVYKDNPKTSSGPVHIFPLPCH